MTRKLSVFGVALGVLVAALFLWFPHPHTPVATLAVTDASAITYNPATGPDLRPDVPIVQPQPVVAVHAVGHTNTATFWDGTERALPPCPEMYPPPMIAYNYVHANPYPSEISYAVWYGKNDPAPSYTVSNWGSIGNCPQQFNTPTAVAAYDGKLYVVDHNNHRIMVTDLHGNFLCKFGSFGTEPGEFSLPGGIAVYDGCLYVADSGNARVQRFTTDGELLGVCNIPPQGLNAAPVGITFDQKTGMMLVTDAANNCITALNPITQVANAAAPVKPKRTRRLPNLMVSNNK